MKLQLNLCKVPPKELLGVVTQPALGLHLRAPEFVPALKCRLGLPICSAEGPCPACSAPSDQMGDHALGCSKYGDRIARHDQLRDVLFEAAASAALAQSGKNATSCPARLPDLEMF